MTYDGINGLIQPQGERVRYSGRLSLLAVFIILFGLSSLFSASANANFKECVLHHFEAHGIASVATREAVVNELVTELVANPGNAQARQRLRELLKFDEQNLSYFLSLYEKKLAGHKEELQIFEAGRSTEGRLTAYPTAIAPPELLSQIPYVQYGSLLKSGLKGSEDYAAAARSSVLWLKKMQAGTGSSLTRQTYLGRIKKIDPKEVRIGAKGTDLYVDVPDPRAPSKTVSISLAEAQILQAIHDAQSGKFSGVVLHDLIGPETEESIAKLWNKKSLIDPSKTYEQILKDLKIVQRSSQNSFQSYMPTIDEAGKISFGREAPGGHGYFGVDALRAAYRDELRPKTGKSLISAVGNGEDLSSTPDAAMVGWMIKKQVPIAMVTTEKTMNDLKGGQIALVKRGDGSTYATIIEQAQAKEAGQQALFEKLGLDVRRGDQVAFFNTNMALFNYDVLTPKIKKLVSEIGEHEFMKIVAPNLISNVKKQKDPDGAVRKYLQLEGAMGSSLLNLDRYWRQHYKEPLVHFINVEKNARTEFFSPIKSAFDYFMQFHSDLFKLDPKNMRLAHQRPGSLPAVSLKDRMTEDKYYADVQNVMHSFQGASLLGLKSLDVDGQVILNDAILRGNVRIHNKSAGKFDLSAYLKKHRGLVPYAKGKPVLENVTLEISEAGEVSKL